MSIVGWKVNEHTRRSQKLRRKKLNAFSSVGHPYTSGSDDDMIQVILLVVCDLGSTVNRTLTFSALSFPA
jgi:hypothetical protein